MKGLTFLFLLCFQLLFSQSNIAVFHANRASVPVEASGGDEVSIAPFELVNGMVVVKASINGILGNFILDTGSPGIVINSETHEKVGGYKATSVGGQLTIGETTINEFKWGIVEKSGITGFTIDLSHLEKAIGKDLAGLIGYELLSQYEVFFDYPNSIIKIYSADKAKEFRKGNPAWIVAPFYMNGHLPMIAFQVGGKKAFLGMDSGAEANLLDDDFFKDLKKQNFSKKAKENVVGLDQKEQQVFSAELKSISLKKMEMPNMRFLFLDLEGLSSQFEGRLDGLLGFPFFQKHTVSINYKERKIYIWN